MKDSEVCSQTWTWLTYFHFIVSRYVIRYVTGGVEIQGECSEFIKTNGHLLPAQLYVSKPGRLPCKAIIHAVGPIWSTGHNNEKNLLYETVFNILEEAKLQRFTSVALPAISTGLYRFPVRLATTTVLTAVKDFLKQSMLPRKLHEVHIIDQSLDVISQFCETAAVVFEDVDRAEIRHASTGNGSSSKVAARVSTHTSRPSE